MGRFLACVVGLAVFFALSGGDLHAGEGARAPECLSGGRDLPVNDSQVLDWETSTRPGFHGRAHVRGPISRLFPDMRGHQHFLVEIGPEPSDGIEIVFDTEYGKIQGLATGGQVEACGDFINTTGEEGHGSYTSSIIHWVHDPFGYSSHEPGYVTLNGVLYGASSDSLSWN